MTDKQTSVNSWDGLIKNYLKADNLEQSKEVFACVGVEVEDKEMNLELEKDEESFTFTLNVTNMVFLKNAGITKPKEAIGKKITLEKVKVYSPFAKKEVDSLRITDVK